MSLEEKIEEVEDASQVHCGITHKTQSTESTYVFINEEIKQSRKFCSTITQNFVKDMSRTISNHKMADLVQSNKYRT
ncbi:hypothetical protein I79_012326 [Cricetulus griseus]|uniref:Uncharacterized protein n=1 Tax=Cricetulus griseus TaxID=10029 RepID=G3HNI9_CRIGR|nr:hypothetical protein I79_012326 [Cricetulus griseus]